MSVIELLMQIRDLLRCAIWRAMWNRKCTGCPYYDNCTLPWKPIKE